MLLTAEVTCRSPHGERGLKLVVYLLGQHGGLGSLPSRGAWIEIERSNQYMRSNDMSLPSRGAWIEITSTAGIDV